DQEAAAAASRTEVAALLARAPEHPAVRAALASLEAARSQLRAARSPVRFEVSSALTRLDVDDIDLDPITPGVQPLDRTLINVSAGLSFRPFAFGDIADLVDQREVAVAQAELDVREALVSVQARTLEAAFQLELARSGVAVAEQGAALARQALAATEPGPASTRGCRARRSRRPRAGCVTARAAGPARWARPRARSTWGRRRRSSCVARARCACSAWRSPMPRFRGSCALWAWTCPT